MDQPVLFLCIVALYAAFVLGVALLVERTASLRKAVENSAVVYALSLAVYNSTWSFYGSVGLAAQSGFMYMPITLGVVLSATLWWVVLRRMVRVKAERRVTSIADFISARYANSQSVAVLVTVMALVGSLPYVALQMRAILSSLRVVVVPLQGDPAPLAAMLLEVSGPFLVIFTTVFTILVGVRRLDPTERHQGMVAAVAVESVVKLVALLAVGVYVIWVIYDGPNDIHAKNLALPWHVNRGVGDGGNVAYMRWTTMMLLAVWAVLFLPRQFHVAVVENSDERHILTAMWLFPLFAVLLQVVVTPIAMGGLALGLPRSQADTFVLRLPMMHGAHWLGGLAFIGGFSAGMSMIMVSAMTMATMITNHIVLPLAEAAPGLRGLRLFILQCRWGVVAAYLCLGYVFHLLLGESYLLVNIGIISFSAVLQFAPAVVGGMLWRDATPQGALAGLGTGFVVWGYTLLLPAFVNSGLLPSSLQSEGPWGLGFLRPEALLGLDAMDPLTHSVFWSLLCNAGAYAVVSLCTTGLAGEQRPMGFGDMPTERRGPGKAGEWESHIHLVNKRGRLTELFASYHPRPRAQELADRCVSTAGIEGAERINIRQLMDLYAEAERLLAGMVGTAAAYRALRTADLYTARETMELSEVYAGLLAELKLSPDDLAQRVDYYQEREAMLTRHAEELLSANSRLRQEVAERRRAEVEAYKAESRYRSIFENALEGLFQSTMEGRLISANPAMARFLGFDSPEQLLGEVLNVSEQLYMDPSQREVLLRELEKYGGVSGYEINFRRRDGTPRWGGLHAHVVRGEDGRIILLEGILEDIEDRKRAEDQLRKANRYVQDIIDSMPSVMVGVDGAGAVTNWNRAAAEVLGLADDAKGRPLAEAHPDLAPVARILEEALDTGEPQRLGKLAVVGGGETRYRDVMVFPLTSGGTREVVVRIDDVTERVLMEEMMIQTEKMMSVGGLAAGMAHEINNPLGGILQSVQNIGRRLADGLPANEQAAEAEGCTLAQVRGYLGRRRILDMVDGIRASGLRAAEIVANMLDFSRRNEAGRSSVDINEVLDNAVELASSDYDLKKKYDFRNIRIERDYEQGLPPLICARTEIEQVVLNLLKNAAHAMFGAESGNGVPTITLSTRREGDWLRIRVADNGPGMDEGTRKRVFEPFFTTKEAGMGTGLGLSVSFFIVTSKHGGSFTVDSAPGQGAAFNMLLPLEPAAFED
ncbi:PAS domain S-box protein [Desulfocurvus sp. DL9XJH121]